MYHKERGYRYLLQFHFGWACYKKQNLLTKESIDHLKECLEKNCESKEISIIESEIKSNYVYLVLDCQPKHIIPDLLKSLKGSSARYLMKQDSHIVEVGSNGVWDALNIIGTDASVLEELKNYVRD